MSKDFSHVLQSCHELTIWLSNLIDHQPYAQRVQLSTTLEPVFSDVAEQVLRASYTDVRLCTALQLSIERLLVFKGLLSAAFERKHLAAYQYHEGLCAINGLKGKLSQWLQAVSSNRRAVCTMKSKPTQMIA